MKEAELRLARRVQGRIQSGLTTLEESYVLPNLCPNTAQHLRWLGNGRLTGTAVRGGQAVGVFSKT